jgi:hypothetical protein
MTDNGHWIKLYNKIIWDAKIRELSTGQRWFYVTLLILCSENAGKMQPECATYKYLALSSGCDLRIVRNSLAKLSEIGLIMLESDGGITIPNWYKYQSSTQERANRKGRQNAGVDIDKNRLDKSRIEIDSISGGENPNIELNDSLYLSLKNTWNNNNVDNGGNLLSCRSISDKTKHNINARARDYTESELIKIIEGYVKVMDWAVNGKTAYWTHSYPFADFWEPKNNLDRWLKPEQFYNGKLPQGFVEDDFPEGLTEEGKTDWLMSLTPPVK